MKKRCPSCDSKVDSKFSFCPSCGLPLKKNSKEEFGMLGENDSVNRIQNELKLPFGMEKMMNSLIKQLERQMGSIDFNDVDGMPKGIKIRVARGNPAMNQIVKEAPKKVFENPKISDKEKMRRVSLAKVNAESRVKRLSDLITYEIEAPGVKSKDEVELIELATGIEVRAYSRDKCYVKFIPLKVEVSNYYVSKEKVFVEIKN